MLRRTTLKCLLVVAFTAAAALSCRSEQSVNRRGSRLATGQSGDAQALMPKGALTQTAAGSNYCSTNLSDPGCVSPQPLRCQFNGQEVPEGKSVSAFLNSSVPIGESCISEERTCTEGRLAGVFQFAACAPGAPVSCLFNDLTIAHGAEVTAYLNSTPGSAPKCESETRKCAQGELSGSFPFAICGKDGAAA